MRASASIYACMLINRHICHSTDTTIYTNTVEEMKNEKKKETLMQKDQERAKKIALHVRGGSKDENDWKMFWMEEELENNKEKRNEEPKRKEENKEEAEREAEEEEGEEQQEMFTRADRDSSEVYRRMVELEQQLIITSKRLRVSQQHVVQANRALMQQQQQQQQDDTRHPQQKQQQHKEKEKQKDDTSTRQRPSTCSSSTSRNPTATHVPSATPASAGCASSRGVSTISLRGREGAGVRGAVEHDRAVVSIDYEIHRLKQLSGRSIFSCVCVCVVSVTCMNE